MARKRCPNGTRRIGNKCVKKSRDDLEFEAYERWENRKEAKREKEMLDWDYTHGGRATMPNYRYRKSRR